MSMAADCKELYRFISHVRFATIPTAPEIVKSIIPPTASKSGIDTSRAMKEAMSKVPLLGGMFK